MSLRKKLARTLIQALGMPSDGDVVGFIDGDVAWTQAAGGGPGSGSQVCSSTTAPTAYRSEIKEFTLTGNPTGGTFTINVNGTSTAPIAYNATGAAVQAAVEAVAPTGTVVYCYDQAGAWYMNIAYPHGTAYTETTFDGAGLTGGTSPDVDNTWSQTFTDTTSHSLPVGSLYLHVTYGADYAFRGTFSLYQMVELKDNVNETATRKTWALLIASQQY